MIAISSRALVPILVAALFTTGPANAAPASFTAGKGQLLCGAAGQQAATWSGACRDGVADGAGTATWTDGTTPNKLDGTLARGEVSGGATLVYGGSTYIGTFRHFEPHGQGFFQYSDGSMYEGSLDNDAYQGPGILLEADRSRYEGEWVAGRRDGQGRATFAMGGSYDGHWHNDRFDGLGTVVYIGGRTWTGQFRAGRPADAPPLAAVEQHTYRITNTSVPVGTLIPSQTASSPVSGARWAELSEGERRIVRARYTALEEGDEPPYPIDGMRPLIAGLTKASRIDPGFSGWVRMHAMVGADGKPTSVTMISKLPPELGRFMGTILMLTTYKPAVCHGKPCAMPFPMAFHFETKL